MSSVDKIVERLTTYDRIKGPPGSAAGMEHVGFGRYDHVSRPRPPKVSREVSSVELDTILARLATPYEKKFRGGWKDPAKPDYIRDENECQAIFQRLGEFDIKKGPPGSNGGKVHLGYNRYDFGPGPKAQKPGPYRPPGEVTSIIERLATFDITKGPPGSRGHEKRSN